MTTSSDYFSIATDRLHITISCPSLIPPLVTTQFYSACEAVYDIEMRAKRVEGNPDFPFRVQQLHHFEAVSGEWTELYNQIQLANGGQVFAFQPTNALHSDAEGLVPAPRAVATWTPGVGGAVSTVPRCAVPSLDAASRRDVAFAAICSQSGETGITYWGLRQALDLCQITLTTLAIGDILTGADVDRDGRLNATEWQLFSEAHIGLVDAIYFRLSDVQGKHHSIASALDDEIHQEKLRLKEFTKQEKDAKKAQQKRIAERLSQGKASYITTYEVEQQERFIARLAAEERKRQEEVEDTKMRMRKAELQRITGRASPERLPTAKKHKPRTSLSMRAGMPRPSGPLSPALRKGITSPRSSRKPKSPKSPAASVPKSVSILTAPPPSVWSATSAASAHSCVTVAASPPLVASQPPIGIGGVGGGSTPGYSGGSGAGAAGLSTHLNASAFAAPISPSEPYAHTLLPSPSPPAYPSNADYISSPYKGSALSYM